ncbi:unnamed protein product [Rotaria sordida]|uniref:ABC transporter domain-containing protein n=1 Tax=Rotaria sordida TaxID=392033 RepID=A0A815WMF1_9BILA|nr:unnamed protein product [Rotaria sordida]CAF1549653.1 unnamed protein product [Rotaria sordida]
MIGVSSTIQKWQMQIIHSSLLDIKKFHPNVTAIVNAANVYMRGGGGLDGAIHAAAGSQLLAELKQLVPHKTQTAQVIVTKGYKTGFDYILHVAGPVYSSTNRDESRRLLEATYRNVIQEADKLKTVTALALASISTGIYGYPLNDAAPIAISTVARELSQAQNLNTVIFAMFEKREFDRLYTKTLKRRAFNYKKMNGNAPMIDITNNGGEVNQSYVKSQNDSQLSTIHGGERGDKSHLSRTSSASTGSMRVIYEKQPDGDKNEITFVSPPSAHSSNHSHQQHRRSTGIGPNERLLSILDPMSDRVSTILVWQNLIVSSRQDDKMQFFRRLTSKDAQPKTKRLLHNVSGAITGGLWAVMGPSGSGKSTLLNTLACRLDVNTIVEGEMRLNGAPYDNAELKRIAGYVMQDDLLSGYLTIEETLMFTAELRLPRTFLNLQRQERVNEVLDDLGLTHARHDIVGIQSKRGISGSERKRLCVAMQLLNRPQLLFLDEPTTGLDSVTALDLLYTLHALAHGKSQAKAITIVCSIHQPQAKIFNLFDSIILLKAGHIMYQGSRKQSTEVFRAAGFPCPLFTNPADHLLDVITPPKTDQTNADEPPLSLEQQAAVDEALIKAQPPFDIDLNMGVNKRLALMANLPPNPTWLKQVQILFRRNLREQLRKIHIVITSILQTVIMAVLIGTVFLKIGTTQKSIVRREPVIFFCAINQGVFGALTVINSFPVERTLTLRERASGTYYASAYFIAKILSDTLVQLPIPILFTCVVYFLIGLQLLAGKFFLFMLFIILCSITSTSLALMISALCRTTSLSVTVLPMVLEVTRLFGGFFIAPSRVPKYLSWIDALSYIKYTFVGSALNELHGLNFTCEGVKTTIVNATYNITAHCIRTGEELIQERGYNYISIGGCIGVLLAFIIFCRTWAFIGVRFLKH